MKFFKLSLIILFLVTNAFAEDMVRNPATGELDVVFDQSTEIETTTTNFNNNLSSADDTVQKALDTLDNATITGAPNDATYITQISNATLTNEQNLASLASGLLKNTTATGVLSIATQGTDYYAPAGTDVAVADGGTNKSSWTLYAIPYLSGTTTFGEILIGAANSLLTTNETATGYTFAALGGDVTGTIGATVVGDDSHAHTTTTISGVDISADTNLSGDTENVLTGDALSIGAGITRDTEWDTIAEINTASTDADVLIFQNIAVSGQTTVASDAVADTVTLAGAGINAITTNAATDTITITATEVDGSTTNEIQNLFETIATTSGTNPVADTSTDTLTLTAGSGITITGNSTTDTVTIAATGGMSDAEFNSVMSAQGLSAIEQLRHTVQAYQHYGDLAVDAFSTNAGIASGTSYTYTGASDYDVKLSTTGSAVISFTTPEPDFNSMGDNAGTEVRQAQTFTLGSTSNISAIKYKLGSNLGAPTGNHTIRIETVSAGVPTGTLAHANLTLTQAPTASAWNTATFASSASLTSGTYAIVIQVPNQATDDRWRWSMDTAGTNYTGGTNCASTDGGSTWTAGSFDNLFEVFEVPTSGNFQTITYALPATPTKMGVVLKLNANDANVTADVSRDAGTTFTNTPLTQIGTTGYYRSTSLTDVSGQPSAANARVRVNWASSSATKCQGVSLYAK